ncbi:hypothetical protein [Fibrobacter sp.]|uniref:hypothetical protein n=1 Tax=Fibrobacter sp. TaxID=35828 RepID=UPI0038670F0A
MIFINPNQISAEENHLSKVDLIEPVITSIPYNSLPDRNFEILVYRLFEKNIPIIYKDKEVTVHLMEGVGDQGRDVSFVLNGNIDGVVQCKNYKSKFTKPALIKEIIKTALFMKKEGTLQYFNKYWIAAPEGCTSEAQSLIRNFTSLIAKENIDVYFNQVRDDYEAFDGLDYANESSDLSNLFNRLQVFEITKVQLDSLLEKSPDVKRMHFKTTAIIDCDYNKKMIQDALKESGIPFLNDDDLNILKDKLVDIPENYRTRLLGFDIYGLPRSIFGKMSEDELDFLQSAKKLLENLNKMWMNQVVKDIQDSIFSQVTIPLVYTKKVHQHSVSFCAPYITKCALFVLHANTLPKEISKKICDEIKKEDVEKECKQQILSIASDALNGDFSSFVGDANLIELKKNIMNYSLTGLKSIEEVSSQLEKDLAVLKPICDSIAEAILEKYKYPRTVIIHELSIWNSDKYMHNAGKTMQDINKQ